MSKITAFLKDESGATAIEYGLIAAGIACDHCNCESDWHDLEHKVRQNIDSIEISFCAQTISVMGRPRVVGQHTRPAPFQVPANCAHVTRNFHDWRSIRPQLQGNSAAP